MRFSLGPCAGHGCMHVWPALETSQPLSLKSSAVVFACLVASIAIDLLNGWLYTPAEASEERVALMLSGSACEENHKALVQYFKTFHGVKAIDLASVPGFALLDVEVGTTAFDEFTATFNRANSVLPQCQAQIMESCISMPAHSVGSHHNMVTPLKRD